MSKRNKLPPDPEGKNGEHAIWAHKALIAFSAEVGTDPEDAICDLIADLGHLCDRMPIYGDLKKGIERGLGHYAEETGQ